jgi:protein associated with RNAse G/E
MFYRDRLNDEYETHQRHYSYLKDDLDVLVADASVKKQSWLDKAKAHLGDALISAGNSMKEHKNDYQSTKLSTITR